MICQLFFCLIKGGAYPLNFHSRKAPGPALIVRQSFWFCSFCSNATSGHHLFSSNTTRAVSGSLCLESWTEAARASPNKPQFLFHLLHHP